MKETDRQTHNMDDQSMSDSATKAIWILYVHLVIHASPHPSLYMRVRRERKYLLVYFANARDVIHLQSQAPLPFLNRDELAADTIYFVYTQIDDYLQNVF